ncbi:hypothetical protein IE981_25340 [Klebsiella pneumoniae]|uniref:HpcH/HpaI aldolase/citrate lyase domain-containing protein n=1 Tax=Klebsiella pneumoniae TaxID=573 RepID=A0A927DA28_KLEPN|nr:hypothetical protein [Klebsiella pneumoniae]MBD3701068.1 hypothetical protein [Klebsiella pneumoniae]MBD3744086.1 hypothetical protein [Klebsiella pneumoniae]
MAELHLILHGGDRCDVGIRLAADRRRACPEHHSGSLSSAAGDCPYASQPVIRPVEGNRSLIKQVLDIGARTLLVPMVDTAEQAREVVSATRYPPSGAAALAPAWRERRAGEGWRIIWRRRMTNSVC